jgi:hypothetical protein
MARGLQTDYYIGVWRLSHTEINPNKEALSMKKSYQKPAIAALGLLRDVTKVVYSICIPDDVCPRA